MSFFKWRSDGTLDYASPVPSPFNYGCIPGTVSGDGEPIDAIVLGPRLPRGTRVCLPERGRVRFVDAGEDDPKLILSSARVTRAQRVRLIAFFHFYAQVKRVLNRMRGRHGPTRFDALEIDE